MGAFKEKIREVLKQQELTDADLRKRLLEMLAEQETLHKMTYEEFLAWADEDTLAEWVEGDVIMASPASTRHQRIGRFLNQVIGQYVESRELGETLPPPYQMKLSRSGREPDLLFVAAEHLDRIKKTIWMGRPTWWWKLFPRKAPGATAGINSTNTSRPASRNTG